MNNKIIVRFYENMGHLITYPKTIPWELLNTVYNEYIEEYFITDKNITTRHHRLKTNRYRVQIRIDNINYDCVFDLEIDNIYYNYKTREDTLNSLLDTCNDYELLDVIGGFLDDYWRDADFSATEYLDKYKAISGRN